MVDGLGLAEGRGVGRQAGQGALPRFLLALSTSGLRLSKWLTLLASCSHLAYVGHRI